jgi:hypothetical protein
MNNECTRKKFQECHLRNVFLSRTQKEFVFLGFFSWLLIFESISNAHLFYFFYKSLIEATNDYHLIMKF